MRGAYSAALPGQTDQRPRLAKPLDGRLFFAGEATSPEFHSTAHGARVVAIDWSGKALRLSTPKGELRAKKVIVTASTEILSGGHIGFEPALPDWKQEAAAALPLGNHNRICLVYDRNVFGDPSPQGATLLDDGAEPMSFSIRPFGYDYVVGLTGGRFADWLERAGIEASVAHLTGIETARKVARALQNAQNPT